MRGPGKSTWAKIKGSCNYGFREAFKLILLFTRIEGFFKIKEAVPVPLWLFYDGLIDNTCPTMIVGTVVLGLFGRACPVQGQGRG